MQFTLFTVAFLTSLASARDFTLYNDANYNGDSHRETRWDDHACWNLNGKGDQASSVRGGKGCTIFFRERGCSGASWEQRGSAPTVPDFLNDHIWSFRNDCCDFDGQALCIATCTTGCALLGRGAPPCIEQCGPQCAQAYNC